MNPSKPTLSYHLAYIIRRSCHHPYSSGESVQENKEVTNSRAEDYPKVKMEFNHVLPIFVKFAPNRITKSDYTMETPQVKCSISLPPPNFFSSNHSLYSLFKIDSKSLKEKENQVVLCLTQTMIRTIVYGACFHRQDRPAPETLTLFETNKFQTPSDLAHKVYLHTEKH